MSKRIWITWENQRRNRTLSKAVHAELFQLDFKYNRWLRYGIASFRTIFLFIRERPGIIFAQNPSLLLALLAVHYGKISKTPVVIDAHNAGLFPFEGRKDWANKVSLHILRRATVVVVTNENLKRYVEKHGGTAFVLPDPLPEFDRGVKKKPLKGKYNIIFICTYAQDEPYLEVFKAAHQLDKGIIIYTTGNPKERDFSRILPENVVVTGYLSEEEYVQLLHSADILIDLTTREDCLLCGAYEAVALGKPVILSDTNALKEYFFKGAVYVDNTSADLAAKIRVSIAHIDQLRKEITELKDIRTESWGDQKRSFDNLLNSLEQAKD